MVITPSLENIDGLLKILDGEQLFLEILRRHVACVLLSLR